MPVVYTAWHTDSQGDLDQQLYEGVLRDDLVAVQRLLESTSGQAPDHINRTYGYLNETQLHAACNVKNLEIVKLLLEAGATIQTDKSGKTPLHIAATRNCLDIIEALFDKHPNKDYLVLCDKNGDTALTCAIRNGHLEIVKLLLEAESDMKPGISWDQLFNEHTAWLQPAHLACCRGKLDILKYFIDTLGVDVNSRTPAGKRIKWPSIGSLRPSDTCIIGNYEVSLLECVLGYRTPPDAIPCLEYLLCKQADIPGTTQGNDSSAVDNAWRMRDFRALALIARWSYLETGYTRWQSAKERHMYGIDHNVSHQQLQGTVSRQRDACHLIQDRYEVLTPILTDFQGCCKSPRCGLLYLSCGFQMSKSDTLCVFTT